MIPEIPEKMYNSLNKLIDAVNDHIPDSIVNSTPWDSHISYRIRLNTDTSVIFKYNNTKCYCEILYLKNDNFSKEFKIKWGIGIPTPYISIKNYDNKYLVFYIPSSNSKDLLKKLFEIDFRCECMILGTEVISKS